MQYVILQMKKFPLYIWRIYLLTCLKARIFLCLTFYYSFCLKGTLHGPSVARRDRDHCESILVSSISMILLSLNPICHLIDLLSWYFERQEQNVFLFRVFSFTKPIFKTDDSSTHVTLGIASVARWWNKKLPNFPLKLPKK